MPTLTGSFVDQADAIKVLLQNNAVTLGLRTIYYGEDFEIPDFPSAEVTAGPQGREPATTGQYGVDTSIFVVVFLGKLQMPEINARDADLLAESIKGVLHANRRLDGLVIHSWVERIEPGLVRTPRGMYLKGTRLAWRSMSRELI